MKAPILLGGEDAMDEDEQLPDASQYPTGGASASAADAELISAIITPSPFPHHTTGPTSSRFRNALSRVTTNPSTDVEAWQAILTEVQACSRMVNKHAVSAETQLQLDWMESCYGALLKYFPYASAHVVAIVELLMGQSARVGEEDGPVADYGLDLSQRTSRAQRKMERLLERSLGIHMDGSPLVPDTSKDEVSDEAKEDSREGTNLIGGMCTSSVELWLLYIRARNRDAQRQAPSLPTGEGPALIRKWTGDAYELAIQHAGFGFNNHLLWKQYVNFVKAWIPPGTTDHVLQQQQMLQLRSVYQRLVCNPMTGLDQLWQEYEAFERAQSEALAQALIGEFAPKYQHARTVYLERSRVYAVQDLQLGRLATPPVQATEGDDDYATKLAEEYQFLTLWKKRAAYERTNPERLSAADLAHRVRQSYKEMACVLTRHPEAWHMWSMWELQCSKEVDRARAVLQLGQQNIPDCTLLAYAEAELVEMHTSQPEQCHAVMESFLERSPNTLGFILLQQMVRRYQGIDKAREVFARARRVLVQKEPTPKDAKNKDINKATEGQEEEKDGEKNEDSTAVKDEKRWVVTNRLDASIGAAGNADTDLPKKEVKTEHSSDEAIIKPGVITWHLYASHATIEHRLNRSPDVAARVYELGLRKHVSFLTKPPYVMRYAQLLLELQDTVNLRALLTRAVAACEQQDGNDSAVGALWDMTLRFESLLSGADPTNIKAIEDVERRRRAALMGPDIEDVASGGIVGVDSVSIGVQKTTITEQLVRAYGYDVSSSIVNGLSRTVDMLDVMGLWGDGVASSGGARNRSQQQQMSMKALQDEEMPGGSSDATYQQRLKYQSLVASGVNAESAFADQSAPGNKLLSARERLGTAGPGQNTAMNMAIQQMPDWLKPLALLLPASKFRTPVLMKPPPHLTELALNTLKLNNLPAERPADEGKTSKNLSGVKRSANGGDSSDEEDEGAGGAGYGAQFRARQRARMAAAPNGMSD